MALHIFAIPSTFYQVTTGMSHAFPLPSTFTYSPSVVKSCENKCISEHIKVPLPPFGERFLADIFKELVPNPITPAAVAFRAAVTTLVNSCAQQCQQEFSNPVKILVGEETRLFNSRGGFVASVPSNAFGSTIRFNVSSAIPTIAQNTNMTSPTNAWATAGNLLNRTDRDNYVECSLTFVDNIAGPPRIERGWYFWYGFDRKGTYIPLNYDPTGHNFQLWLYNISGQWKAQFNDITTGRSGIFNISGAPNVPIFTGSIGCQFFLESALTTCALWSSLSTAAVTFSNLIYLDAGLSPITFTPTFAVTDRDHQPKCAVFGPQCLMLDIPTLTVSWLGC